MFFIPKVKIPQEYKSFGKFSANPYKKEEGLFGLIGVGMESAWGSSSIPKKLNK